MLQTALSTTCWPQFVDQREVLFDIGLTYLFLEQRPNAFQRRMILTRKADKRRLLRVIVNIIGLRSAE